MGRTWNRLSAFSATLDRLGAIEWDWTGFVCLLVDPACKPFKRFGEGKDAYLNFVAWAESAILLAVTLKMLQPAAAKPLV